MKAIYYQKNPCCLFIGGAKKIDVIDFLYEMFRMYKLPFTIEERGSDTLFYFNEKHWENMRCILADCEIPCQLIEKKH